MKPRDVIKFLRNPRVVWFLDQVPTFVLGMVAMLVIFQAMMPTAEVEGVVAGRFENGTLILRNVRVASEWLEQAENGDLIVATMWVWSWSRQRESDPMWDSWWTITENLRRC